MVTPGRQVDDETWSDGRGGAASCRLRASTQAVCEISAPDVPDLRQVSEKHIAVAACIGPKGGEVGSRRRAGKILRPRSPLPQHRRE